MYAEQFCCPQLVAFCVFKGGSQEWRFHAVDPFGMGMTWELLQKFTDFMVHFGMMRRMHFLLTNTQVFNINDSSRCHQNGFFENLTEFSPISRPMVGHKHGQCRIGEGKRSAGSSSATGQKVSSNLR